MRIVVTDVFPFLVRHFAQGDSMAAHYTYVRVKEQVAFPFLVRHFAQGDLHITKTQQPAPSATVSVPREAFRPRRRVDEEEEGNEDE